MNIKQLSSDGKITYLIKPILKVLQGAGDQLERSEVEAALLIWMIRLQKLKRSPRKPEAHIRNSTSSSILQLRFYSLSDYQYEANEIAASHRFNGLRLFYIPSILE